MTTGPNSARAISADSAHGRNSSYKTRGKVVPIFGKIYYAGRNEFTFSFRNPDPGTNGTREKLFLSSL